IRNIFLWRVVSCPRSIAYGGISSMNMATRRTAARLGIACAIIWAAATLAPGARAEEWAKSYTISGRAQVRVDTNDGAVRIATGDSQQVEFRVIYEGYELNKNLHIDSRQDGDSVQVNARVTGHWGFSWGRGHRGPRIEVRMPKDADLQIDTGDGSVETQPISGRVKIHTGDGSVRVQAVDGNVDIDTGDGSITLEGAKGDIRLHTGDGRIDARVEPGSKLTGGWSIHTGDGSVDLVLPADLQANIDASTNDGHISMGIPVTVEGTFSNSQIHGKMNGGGQSLTIHTGDGSIRLSKSS